MSDYQGPAEHIVKMNQVEEWFQSEHHKVMEKLGVGFAFGNTQLEEFKKRERDKGYVGEFIGLGYGQISRKDTALQYKQEFQRLMAERKEKMREVITMDQLIAFELSNHECYYTGDWYELMMVASVHDIYPEAKKEDFFRIYKDYYSKINL